VIIGGGAKEYQIATEGEGRSLLSFLGDLIRKATQRASASGTYPIETGEILCPRRRKILSSGSCPRALTRLLSSRGNAGRPIAGVARHSKGESRRRCGKRLRMRLAGVAVGVRVLSVVLVAVVGPSGCGGWAIQRTTEKKGDRTVLVITDFLARCVTAHSRPG